MAVAHACRDAGVPCVVLAGSLGDGYERAYSEGVTAAMSILTRPMAMVDAQEHAAALLRTAARDIVRLRSEAGNPRRKRSS
ncbi:MAG: glycerate kinase [Tepidisphaeraceae bacterium]